MLSICVPVHVSVTAGFALCLANLTARLSSKNIKFKIHMVVGTLLSESRTALVKEAIANNSNQILWLDSDMHFPNTIYEKLNSHEKDIVAATYSTRTNPQQNVAFLDENDFSKRLSIKSGLVDVAAVGMGCMLVNIDVYRQVSFPWFNIEWDQSNNVYIGEDIYFCLRAKDYGYPIIVDADTSNTVGHYGTKIYFLDGIK